jgi:TolB-like protein
MNKQFLILLFFALAAYGQQTSVAVLPSEGVALGNEELEALTDEMREAALKALPTNAFVLLKQDVVVRRLGGAESYIKECKESSCIVDLGKKAQVDYVAQASVGKLGGSIRLKVELYNVRTEGLVGMFNDEAENVRGLLAIVKKKAPEVFGKIPEASGPGLSGGGTFTDSSGEVNFTQPSSQQATSGKTEPALQGTIVPGTTLADKLAWLQRSADSHNTYIVEVNANESIAPHIFEYRGAINITVVVRGVGGNRTIRLKSHGTMFTIRSNVTLILDNNITLHGHNGNTGRMVYVDGGTLKMNTGASITSNNDGGVSMTSGIFEMIGGTISNNVAAYGSGVDINTAGTFTMYGGEISYNTAKVHGGGVGVGGGSTFIMKGGTIRSNIAREYGGGIRIYGFFTKTGGTITGYNSDPANGNVVNDGSGAMARKGHAVYYNENKRKETTVGPGVNLSCNNNSCTGGWDE